MDHDAAIKELSDMVAADTAPSLTPDRIGRALDQAVIPDGNGILPGANGWTPTWDLEWAAAALCEWRAAVSAGIQAGPKQVTSEGTTMVMPDPVDWGEAAARWRSQSALWQRLHGTGVAMLSIDNAEHPYIPSTSSVDRGVWR